MKKYLLLLASLFTAFVFAGYAGNNIFMANTPQVNPNYLANLQSQFKKNVNNVYLAFSSLKKFGIKKDIAVVYPTMIPRKNTFTNPTIVPNVTKTPEKPKFAQIDPATIPANLFKYVSKGVSAYEGEGDNIVIKIDKGTTYKVRKLKLSNGKIIEIIDLTGQ
ncbi:MAG: hypothetical protein AAB441_01635 [Patescibacteria group bacterium]